MRILQTLKGGTKYFSQRAISKKSDEIMNKNEKSKGDEYIVGPSLRQWVGNP